MKLLVTMDNPRAAQAFIDYMAVQSIVIELKPQAERQFGLWVDEQAFTYSAEQLQLFLLNPQDKKYLDASWQRNAEYNPLSYQGDGGSLIKTWLANGGWVTHTVVILCVALFILRYIPSLYPALLFPAHGTLAGGELWRWVTPALLHFSFIHIAFNLLWWWQLAGQLEKHFSSSFIALFALFTALISNFAQYMIANHNQFGGLSGVVFALIGFCWLFGRLKPQKGIKLADPVFVFALIWLVLGYADLLWVSMANTAHLAGLLSGMAFALATAKTESFS